MATRRKSLEEIEKQMTGGEPRFTAEVVSESDMMLALNWYNQNRDSKQATKYINDYLKKQKIKCGADAVNKQSSTFGFLCRMKNNGAVFSTKHDVKFKGYLDAMLALKEKPVVVEKEEKKPTVSIQDRVAEKVSEMCGELEGAFDEYILNGFKNAPSPYGVMHGMNVKAMHAKAIAEWFKYRRSEFEEILDTKDKQLIEGYSNFKKTEIKKLVAWCDQVITDCVKITGEAKVTRKPRKRKEKSPDQLVAKVKLCESDDNYKIKSLPAKDMIGAIQLWVFNVKYKRLTVYNADDARGFTIKGTTLQNFSESKSVTKTLRKPDVTLKEVLTGGKVVLRNLMDKLTTKPMEANGRLNAETVLLKVVR